MDQRDGIDGLRYTDRREGIDGPEGNRWVEKEMRRRKWFPLISEELITTGGAPPRGKLGKKYRC